MQKLVDGDAFSGPLHAAGLQREVVQIGDAPGGVYDQIALDREVASALRDGDGKDVPLFLNRADWSLDAHVDSDFAAYFDDAVDEIRIETGQHARAALQNRYRGPGSRRHVSELERNIASTDECDAGRQSLQLEKSGAGNEVLLARQVERRRAVPGGQHDPRASTASPRYRAPSDP